MKNDTRLGNFLREVSNWPWLEFIRAEHNDQFTSNQAIIFALIRACAMRNLQAIKSTTNRLDGKLATPLKIEYPKVFYLFPNAKPPEVFDITAGEQPISGVELSNVNTVTVHDVTPEESEEVDLATLSIRETVTEMANYPRQLPEAICQSALELEMFYRNQGPMPADNPMVKSVVAAHLLVMAGKGSMDALNEVFDQIDGKLAETFQVLGEDLYITSYASTAPEGAYLNKDGVLELEAVAVQDAWAYKLGKARE